MLILGSGKTQGNDPIEIPYYKASHPPPPLCYQCGYHADLEEEEKHYPRCPKCKDEIKKKRSKQGGTLGNQKSELNLLTKTKEMFTL